jgi:hypothetical protein
MTLGFSIRACLTGRVSRAIQTTPKLGTCVSHHFRAYVAGDTIRRVVFSLDGRRVKATQVADWQGRYWVDVDPASLKRGRHELSVTMSFIAASKTKPRELKLTFRRCA